jgi:tRNA pseudouridine55 synthase
MPRRRKHPAFRELDGILLLDKPGGMSSNAALQLARRLYRAEKGGHTGALDPLATGLLPLCFGETTKIAGLLLSERKSYETLARFGIETDTADADGIAIERRPVPPLTRAAVEAALVPFIGRIQQVPPIYSALKLDGEPLYVRARRGEIVEVPAREVVVDRIELLELGVDFARLQVDCGSGTYIRSLVRDLGAVLGCGAHVEALRRLWVDPFRAPCMHTLEALQGMDPVARDAVLLPIEAGLTGFPRVALDADQSKRLGQGQAVSLEPGTADRDEAVAYGPDGRALGLVDRIGAEVRPRRLFHAARAAAAMPLQVD